MDQDETWLAGRPWPWTHCVRWGPSHPASPPPKGHTPQFSAHICCGQRAARIKMPLGVEVGLCPGELLLDGDPLPLSKKGRSPLICGPCLLRSDGCMDQDATCYGGRPRFTRHCVRWGPSSLPKGAQPPIFGQCPLWSNGCMSQDTEVCLGPGDFVFDGDPAPPRKKDAVHTQFLAHVCCGQTAGWIKMALGTEVNLGPGDVVLDGVAAPP